MSNAIETASQSTHENTIQNYDALQQDVDLNLVPLAFKKTMKDLGATTRDHVAVPLDKIRFRENYNVRLDGERYRQRVEHIAQLMLANGYQQDKPITGFVAEEDGEQVAYVVSGHTRVRAARRANELGASIEYIPMLSVPKGTNEIDLIFDLTISNDGAPLTLYEQGVVNQRLINRGISVAEIARRLQRSETHIRNSLELRSAPRAIIEHVEDGRISETLALELMRKHGNAAIKMIEDGVEKAKTEGRTKVTSTALRGRRLPAPLGMNAISTVENLVQALDPAVLDSVNTQVSQAEEGKGLNGEATVSLPLEVVRQLLALKGEIDQAREKIAKKEAKAQARDTADDNGEGERE